MFTATPKQIEAYQALQDNDIVLYGGAIRGAKTYWGILMVVLYCFKYPKSRWLMLRESWGNVTGKLLVTFNECFLEKGLEPHIASFPKNSYVLTFKNGSQIVFMAESYSTDKELNRFRGLEINGAFIDEMNEIQEATLNKIIERAGSWFHSPGCPSKIFGSCNPSQGWVKTRFYNPWKTGTLPPKYAYIPARITDNPHVPPEYIESLKNLPAYDYQVFVEGNWDVSLKTGGEFLKNFELNQHVRPVYVENTTIHVSIDSNVYPYFTVTFWQLIKEEKWIIRQIHEICANDPNNTAHRAGLLARKWLESQGYNQKIFLYGDRSTKNRNNIDEQKRSVAEIFSQALSRDKGFTVVEKFLPHAPSVSNIADFINNIFDESLPFARFEISEKCSTSITDYIETKQDRDGSMLKKRITDPKTNVSYEPHGHITDTLKDFVISAFHDEFLKFQDRFKNLGKSETKIVPRATTATF